MRGATRIRLLLITGLLVAIAVAAVYALVQVANAGRVGKDAKAALVRAEEYIESHDLEAARAELLDAQADFRKMRDHLHGMGPLRPVGRITPVLGTQISGADAFADAGIMVSEAGLNLVNAAARVLEPENPELRIAEAVKELRNVRTSLVEGIDALDQAAAKVQSLEGDRLYGPLGEARDDFVERVPRVDQRAKSARLGLDALIDVLGGNGPRRFLVVSQNPDEVRPTGGFIGSYGLLVAERGEIELDQYDGIGEWYRPRPQAALPPSKAAPPLRLSTPPVRQTIANVNATADFTAAGELAATLWESGGEKPIDGVISMTPEVMARVLEVLGPVFVPTYGETVTADNVLERVDYYTHLRPEVETQNGTRKDFLVELVHVVIEQLLDAPAARWDPLAQALNEGFNAREAMGWSRSDDVARVLSDRKWDGRLPQFAGDFFYNAEFEYAAKNGRGLQRTFDHKVVLREDGSGTVTTKVTIANTRPPSDTGLLNTGSPTFITVHGPEGAKLVQGADPADFPVLEPLAGHPSAAWLTDAKPLSSTSFTVQWTVPHLATQAADGSLEYSLHFMRLPAHNGDVLKLSVKLPDGWNWNDAPPPKKVALKQDVVGTWRATR